jgi:hypothetical protein
VASWRGCGGDGGSSLKVSSGEKKTTVRQNTTFIVFCLATHRQGLPLPGSPLVVLPPQDPSVEANRYGPHPSAEGRGAFVVAVCGRPGVGVVRVDVVV